MKSDRLDTFGEGDTPILFAHANGFPPGSFRQLFAALGSPFRIIAPRHRAMWDTSEPTRKFTWRNMVQDFVGIVRQEVRQPAWVIGHSMGGTTALLAAQLQPELFQGLILLDPVLPSSRRAIALRLNPQLSGNLKLVQKTLNRPNRWPNRQQAWEFHRRKRAYQNMNDEALAHYIDAATIERAGEFHLAYPRDWEAHVYGNVPLIWHRVHRTKLPTLAVRGEYSDVLTAPYWRRWQRLQATAEFAQIAAAGHLFPLEKPNDTASLIREFLAARPL